MVIVVLVVVSMCCTMLVSSLCLHNDRAGCRTTFALLLARNTLRGALVHIALCQNKRPRRRMALHQLCWGSAGAGLGDGHAARQKCHVLFPFVKGPSTTTRRTLTDGMAVPASRRGRRTPSPPAGGTLLPCMAFSPRPWRPRA